MRPVQTADVPDDAPQRKAALRDAIVSTRRQVSGDARMSASASIAAAALGEWGGSDCIAAYLSFGDEPPTRELIEGFHSRGTRVLVPVIDGARLDWSTYTGATDVADGPLGIIEPTGKRLGARAVQQASVVFVPALAVDRWGHRLGRGRGYYDRTLGGLTAPTVAVVYDDELIDEVPVEAHDRSVRAILRPSGISWA